MTDTDTAIKDLNTSVKTLADAFAAMVPNLTNVAKGIASVKSGVGDASTRMDALSSSLMDGKRNAKLYEMAFQRAMAKQLELSRSLNKSKETQDKIIEKIQLNIKVAADLMDKMNKESMMRKALRDQIDKQVKSYITLDDAVKKGLSSITSLAGKLGVTTWSISGARESLVAFNQSMFSFSRTQQVMGRGAGDVNAAFKSIAESTTFSKKRFAAFLDTAASGWKGVVPTANAIANLAQNLQSAFGPSVEKSEAALKSFLELQDKFPAMANTIASAMDKVQKGIGGVTTEKQRKSLLAQIQVQRAAGNISKEQANTYYQMLTKTTKQQDAQVRSNKALANLNKRSEDAMLNMAQAAEPAMTRLVEATESLVNLLGKMPQQILLISAAFMMMNKNIMIPNLRTVGKGSLFLPGMAGMAGRSGAGLGGAGTGMLAGIAGWFSRKSGGKSTPLTTAPTTPTAPISSKAISWAKASRGLGAGIGMGALSAGISGFSEYDKRKQEGKTTGQALGAAAGKATGALVGGIAGGLGMALIPVVGPALAPVGAILGSMVGEKFADIFIDKAMNSITKTSSKIEEQTEIIGQEAEKYRELLSNFEFAVQAHQKNVDLLKEQCAIMQDMGQIKPGQVDNLFAPSLEGLSQIKNETKQFFSDMFSEGGISDLFKTMDVDLGTATKEAIEKGDIPGAVKAATDQASKQIEELGKKKITLNIELSQAKKSENVEKQKDIESEIESIATKQAAIKTNLNTIQEKSNLLLKTQVSIVDTITTKNNVIAEQAQKYNSIIEGRLDAERSVMEAAQFGMGASIAMMQKQVDLAGKTIKLEQNRVLNWQNTSAEQLKSLGMSEDQASQYADLIKNAESFGEAQELINRVAGTNTDEANLLTKAYANQQDAVTKIYQQQKKIYDITKDVREGYLDAIREMSVGAGEFSKIIGTQEMGVTQLMDTINKATKTGEKNIGNTMKLGGYQSASDTSAGTGTNITGRYSASGNRLSFLPSQGAGDTTETRNRRIRGYEKSQKEYQKMQRGEHQSTVGTGLGDDKYLDATRDANYDGTYNGVMDALSKKGGYLIGGGVSRNIMAPVNTGMLNSRSYNPHEEQNPSAITGWAANTLGGAQGQAPARNVPGTVPGVITERQATKAGGMAGVVGGVAPGTIPPGYTFDQNTRNVVPIDTTPIDYNSNISPSKQRKAYKENKAAVEKSRADAEEARKELEKNKKEDSVAGNLARGKAAKEERIKQEKDFAASPEGRIKEAEGRKKAAYEKMQDAAWELGQLGLGEGKIHSPEDMIKNVMTGRENPKSIANKKLFEYQQKLVEGYEQANQEVLNIYNENAPTKEDIKKEAGKVIAEADKGKKAEEMAKVSLTKDQLMAQTKTQFERQNKTAPTAKERSKAYLKYAEDQKEYKKQYGKSWQEEDSAGYKSPEQRMALASLGKQSFDLQKMEENIRRNALFSDASRGMMSTGNKVAKKEYESQREQIGYDKGNIAVYGKLHRKKWGEASEEEKRKALEEMDITGDIGFKKWEELSEEQQKKLSGGKRQYTYDPETKSFGFGKGYEKPKGYGQISLTAWNKLSKSKQAELSKQGIMPSVAKKESELTPEQLMTYNRNAPSRNWEDLTRKEQDKYRGELQKGDVTSDAYKNELNQQAEQKKIQEKYKWREEHPLEALKQDKQEALEKNMMRQEGLRLQAGGEDVSEEDKSLFSEVGKKLSMGDTSFLGAYGEKELQAKFGKGYQGKEIKNVKDLSLKQQIQLAKEKQQQRLQSYQQGRMLADPEYKKKMEEISRTKMEEVVKVAPSVAVPAAAVPAAAVSAAATSGTYKLADLDSKNAGKAKNAITLENAPAESAAQRKGLEATSADQAKWNASQGQMDTMFGSGTSSGGSGQGLVTVVVQLSSELEGVITQMQNAIGEISRARV